MLKRALLLLTLLVSLAACTAANGSVAEPTATMPPAPTAAPSPAAPTVAIANPASANCAQVGGLLRIEARPDGAEFGVCYFDDNRQCEEWALLRGDCPVGGRKVTGYVTQGGRFCAITGGSYTSTGTDASGQEMGLCTLLDGSECDATAYYEGTCGTAGE